MKKGVLRWIVKNVDKLNMLYLVLLVVSALQSALMVLFALSVKELINSALIPSPKLHLIIKNTIISLVLLVTSYGFMLLTRILIEKCKLSAEVNIKKRVFSNILNKDYSQISLYKSGEILSRISNDSEIVASGYARVLPNLVNMVTRIVLAVSILLYFQPIFTLIMLFGGLVMVAFSYGFRKVSKRLHKATRQADGEVMSYVTETSNNLLAVKVFSAQDKVAKKGGLILDNYGKTAKKQRYVSSTLSSLLSFAFSFFYIATVVWGAIGLYKGISGIDFGMITAMIQLVNQIQGPLANFSIVFNLYYEMISSAERLMEVDGLKDEKPKREFDEKAVYNAFNAIKAENLCFSYDEREQVLNDANFTIKKGDFALIKGISGVGKSTLMRLILGVYDEFKGELYIDTQDGKIPLDSTTRSLFAFVPQGNMLFSGTLRENICFLADNASEQEIQKVIKATCLDFISDLPDGLETPLGENGKGLSEGQGQRVALARALLANKPILLLDEATSALDEDTEKQVLENIKKYYGSDTTCLFISHKPQAESICSMVIQIDSLGVKTYRKSEQ